MSAQKPCSRAGHSAIVFKDNMIVFGGKNDENMKLNDVWSFNLNTYEWSEIRPNSKMMP